MRQSLALSSTSVNAGNHSESKLMLDQISVSLNHMISYTLKKCPEAAEVLRYYNELHVENVTNKQIFAELTWIVYCSGFRFDVIRKYWPSIKKSFRGFEIAEIAFSQYEPEDQARRICQISRFRNFRKALWCIQNARRIIEVDQERRRFGGLKAYLWEISQKSPLDLVSSTPAIIEELKFKGIGQTTIFHFLKNIGINIFKPDIHVRRILSDLRLIADEDVSPRKICWAMSFLSSISGISISELDTLLFLYGKTSHDGEKA